MPHNAPYKIRYVTKPKPSKSTVKNDMSKAPNKLQENPYLRAEVEDDDGYDPYSDRPVEREHMFQRDPWK